jgi:hypothetical protein
MVSAINRKTAGFFRHDNDDNKATTSTLMLVDVRQQSVVL